MTRQTLFRCAALMLAATTAACATYPADAPGNAAPMRTFVPLGQPVAVANDYTVTALKVVEDSRCPTGVQCVWAGRVVVTVRIDGPGWTETTNIVSGERTISHGHDFLLIEVRPAQRPQSGVPASDYRFDFVMDYRMPPPTPPAGG